FRDFVEDINHTAPQQNRRDHNGAKRAGQTAVTLSSPIGGGIAGMRFVLLLVVTLLPGCTGWAGPVGALAGADIASVVVFGRGILAEGVDGVLTALRLDRLRRNADGTASAGRIGLGLRCRACGRSLSRGAAPAPPPTRPGLGRHHYLRSGRGGRDRLHLGRW